MSQRLFSVPVVALALAFAAHASAAPQAPSAECIAFGDQAILRHNGAQFLYLREGSEHYRIGFRGERCDAMTLTSQFSLVTGEATDQLCAGSTQLKAKGRSCLVNRVEKISAEDYARRLRRR